MPDNVLLLPFMARGHLIPFLALARHLQKQKPDTTITIINTPLNIQLLRSSLPSDLTIQFAELPFNAPDHGLPPNCENTSSLPPHLILRFLEASHSLQPSFETLLSALCNGPKSPLCIISDAFMSWSLQSAMKFGVFHYFFSTSGAYGLGVFISVWTHLPHKKTDEEEFSLPDFAEVKLRRSQLVPECIDADGSDPWSILFRRKISFLGMSDGVLVNTVEELESKALEHVRKNLWKRVWAIGPLLPHPSSSSTTSSLKSCVEWLNQHPPDSVLYISFGSESSINLSPMKELAKGLEASGKPFIWVIRNPTGFAVNEEFRAEWLPEGFEERIAERKQGILVKGWAPQMGILGHGSTGAFLSHCGWNSVLESLSSGVPVIGWPIGGEQAYNSKLLEEVLGVGVEMASRCDAEIGADEIGRVVGWVLDNGESGRGREMRRKAKEIEQVMKAAVAVDGESRGSSLRAMEDFIQTATFASKKSTRGMKSW